MDDSMMTPYGPPSPYAYIIPVPNDCVGLIIGKGGDTIRQLQMESGAKIQVAKREIENTNLRNVFVEGPTDKYQRAREMIEEIIKEHRRTADP
jgi:far upstream element-binding protein